MAIESRTNTVPRDYFVWYANDFLKLVVNDSRCLLWPLHFVRQALDPSILFTTVTAPMLSDQCTWAVGNYSCIQLCGVISMAIRLSPYGKVLGSFYSIWIMH
jgi:hypothetical protein